MMANTKPPLAVNQVWRAEDGAIIVLIPRDTKRGEGFKAYRRAAATLLNENIDTANIWCSNPEHYEKDGSSAYSGGSLVDYLGTIAGPETASTTTHECPPEVAEKVEKVEKVEKLGLLRPNVGESPKEWAIRQYREKTRAELIGKIKQHKDKLGEAVEMAIATNMHEALVCALEFAYLEAQINN